MMSPSSKMITNDGLQKSGYVVLRNEACVLVEHDTTRKGVHSYLCVLMVFVSRPRLQAILRVHSVIHEAMKNVKAHDETRRIRLVQTGFNISSSCS